MRFETVEGIRNSERRCLELIDFLETGIDGLHDRSKYNFANNLINGKILFLLYFLCLLINKIVKICNKTWHQ